MGVPALFRWLSRKYPKIVLQVIEEQPQLIPGRDGSELSEIPVDITRPNPNGQENDCLYLDMNGIVHNCTHPEGRPAPKTEYDMMVETFKYTERVVNMARPRKLLLIAIDGVAPRAKMNQQRSRRFRSAEEAKTKAQEKEAAIAEWEAMGKTISDEYKNEKSWDSNAITPGTPFMDLLAASLRYWIAYKMNTDKGWDGLQVIISDASVPGEGEHKIMDFVRRQRSQPGYDPNTNHVFYGLDADLIMLSLATHEPNFKILREDVFAQGAKRGCHKCGQPGHHSSKCTGITPEQKKAAEDAAKSSPLKPFIFLDVSILREYLQVELNVPGLSFAFDLERAIDDWVFMIFFVGNDFLPHLPSLDIREGAIDMLLGIWRKALPEMGGYLVDNGKFNLRNLQLIMNGLASREDEIFRKRREAEERNEEKEKRRRLDEEQRAERTNGGGSHLRFQLGGTDYVPTFPESRPPPPSRPSEQSPQDGPSDHAVGLPAPSATIPAAAPIKHVVPPKPKNPLFVSSARGPSGTAPIRGGFLKPGGSAKPGAVGSSSNGLDVVANRAAIRKANLSAAELLRAELAASKTSQSAAAPGSAMVTSDTVDGDASNPAVDEQEASNSSEAAKVDGDTAAPEEETGDGSANAATEVEQHTASSASMATDSIAAASTGDAVVEVVPAPIVVEADGIKDAVVTVPVADEEDVEEDVPISAVNGDGIASSALADAGVDDSMATDPPTSVSESPSAKSRKRSADEAGIPATRTQAELEEVKEELDDNDSSSSDDEEDEDEDEEDTEAVGTPKPHVPKPLKMLGNNVVEQEDTVKLWEAGYKERYYEQKFGVKIDDLEFRKSIVKSYVEGLSWVLAYYYTGCPSWTWYYPHHFAPFAADFTEIETLDIKFDVGKPFRPFEQLMGVFPAASRTHIPEAFQSLMIEETSEIIDFYPEDFHVDMNGKKMLWQGVALLPFIDQKRLLDALDKKYPHLSDDEHRRNTFGNDVVFVNEENPLYNQIASLYMKRKVDEPVPVDPVLSKGIRGTILPDGTCVPNSTFVSPLPAVGLEDIPEDRSISAIYFMPTQTSPHRSIVLHGYKPVKRVLTPDDVNAIQRGVSGEDSNYRRGPAGDGFHSQRRALEGPGHAARRDARNVVDPRRSSGGNYGQEQGRSGSGYGSGWSSPAGSERSYGSNRDHDYRYDSGASRGRDSYAYGGSGGSYSNGSSSYGYSNGGNSNNYGGRGTGYSTPPQSRTPQPGGAPYGGYGPGSQGGSGSYGSSYGSYQPSQLGQSSYRPPPPPGPASHSYGSYGSYGSPPAPYQPPASHPYPAPQQPYGYGAPAHQPAYAGYGGYGQAAPAPYQPPPPPQSGYGAINRGGILSAHLQQQQGSQNRWNR